MTGIGHGIGFGLYALVAVTGLSALLLAHDSVFLFLQWSGALVLLWLSYNMLTYIPSNSDESHEISGRKGFIEGFLVSFLNPKILKNGISVILVYILIFLLATNHISALLGVTQPEMFLVGKNLVIFLEKVM